MSMNTSDSRPFPVRFDPEQRERLDLLAQLTNRSATDIVREGTQRLLDELSAKPEIRARVDDLVADIRKEADERQAAVNALFGLDESTAPSSEPNDANTGEVGEAGKVSHEEAPDTTSTSTPSSPRPSAKKAPAKKTATPPATAK